MASEWVSGIWSKCNGRLFVLLEISLFLEAHISSRLSLSLLHSSRTSHKICNQRVWPCKKITEEESWEQRKSVFREIEGGKRDRGGVLLQINSSVPLSTCPSKDLIKAKNGNSRTHSSGNGFKFEKLASLDDESQTIKIHSHPTQIIWSVLCLGILCRFLITTMWLAYDSIVSIIQFDWINHLNHLCLRGAVKMIKTKKFTDRFQNSVYALRLPRVDAQDLHFFAISQFPFNVFVVQPYSQLSRYLQLEKLLKSVRLEDPCWA